MIAEKQHLGPGSHLVAQSYDYIKKQDLLKTKSKVHLRSSAAFRRPSTVPIQLSGLRETALQAQASDNAAAGRTGAIHPDPITGGRAKTSEDQRNTRARKRNGRDFAFGSLSPRRMTFLSQPGSATQRLPNVGPQSYQKLALDGWAAETGFVGCVKLGTFTGGQRPRTTGGPPQRPLQPQRRAQTGNPRSRFQTTALLARTETEAEKGKFSNTDENEVLEDTGGEFADHNAKFRATRRPLDVLDPRGAQIYRNIMDDLVASGNSGSAVTTAGEWQVKMQEQLARTVPFLPPEFFVTQTEGTSSLKDESFPEAAQAYREHKRVILGML